MSVSSLRPVMEALVLALSQINALAAFSITDRPASAQALPQVRVGPVAAEPWSTSSSVGQKLTVTLDLTSRTGSFTVLADAVAAIATRLHGAPLALSAGTCVLQDLTHASLHHEAAHDLERASLTLALLVDCGDFG